MATWELLTNEAAFHIWDKTLLSLDDYTTFQSYSFGEYRRALGWEPCHWVAYDERGEIVAMLLGLLRRYPFGFGLVWCEGGPVGDLTVCNESLQSVIKETTGLQRVYCRFRCDRSRQIEDALQLSNQGWTRSWFPLTSDYSMGLDLDQSESEMRAGAQSKWRKNLKLSQAENLNVRRWHDPDVGEVLSVYASTEALKGLGRQQSRDEITELLATMKDQLVLYRCENESGELLSLNGWLLFGDRAWMWLSANNEEGRKLRASYATFWAVVKYLQSNGVRHCDLGGIDPVANRGVYQFKKGSGAGHLEYLGEWDWASKPWLRWFGNWAISRRERLRSAEAKLKSAPAVAAQGERAQQRPSRESLPQPKIAWLGLRLSRNPRARNFGLRHFR